MVFDIMSYNASSDEEILHSGLTPMEVITAVRCNVNSDKEMQRDKVYKVQSLDGVHTTYVSAVCEQDGANRTINGRDVNSIRQFLRWMENTVTTYELAEDMCYDIEYLEYHNKNLTAEQEHTINRIKNNLQFLAKKINHTLIED